MSDAQACKNLVTEGIPNEFSAGDTTIVDETPAKVVEWGTVSLWAQSLSGSKTINLRLPGMTTFLTNLANSSGTGAASEKDGVRYKFINNKESGTTSPVSSL
ncbi:hypothetical protein K491DRAFT_676783 [Lophiostoma macrostomum CBS 122681]|uniref:Uncharacterized protein n=1 Tax=Lophiostoma macrostomum CBS 122681 TaxID=1314788 RepID=A0A6A6TG99_9PLEO|nr:hypothetical protein K491DRAFT_676783 [Lophiostoma macrostomum CBS 122681]